MKMRYPKKALAFMLSLVMVLTSITFDVSVKAELTTEQMIVDATYNLALKKTATANPSKQEGDEAKLTDGDIAGQHAATTFGTKETYFLIDLGATYDASTIDQIVTVYKENSAGDTPVNGYKIEFSANGLDFYTVKDVAGSAVTDACENNALVDVEDLADVTGVVRYVRLLYPASYTWGIQAREIAVLDVDNNAAVVDVEKCDDAAGVTVEVTDYNKFSYNITAGEGQDGYKYIAYLDGAKRVGNGVDAGVDYTVEAVASGTHTLNIYAAYDGKLSAGIVSEEFTVFDISDLINSTRNVANVDNNPLAQIVSVSAFYDGHDINSAQVAIDGNISSGEGSNVAMRTASGSPQNFVLDLGDYYTPAEFEKILLGYSNNRTYAGSTKVEFSFNGTDYVEVGSETGYVCKVDNSGKADLNEVVLDKIADYTAEAVRYVKVTLSAGASNYGYVVNEVALIANTDTPTIVGSDIPNAADVVVEPAGLEKIKYTIVAGEDMEDVTYVVKLGKEVIDESAVAGTEYTYEGLDAGIYVIKVCTFKDGWLSKGIEKNVTVDGYVNYIQDSLNLALKSAHPEVTVTCEEDNRGENYLEGSQEISAGPEAINNGVYTDFAHHTGYLQTRPDKDDAEIDYDLGKDYLPTDIHSLIGMYEANDRAATEYEILFSGDGENFERVFYVKDAPFKKFMKDRVDVSAYTQDTVRYIKYKIITGKYSHHYNNDGTINWGSDGYHLCELAVMGNETLRPEKVTVLEALSEEYNQLTVNWEDVADTECTYNIYVNGTKVGSEIASGVQTMTYNNLPAGTTKVKIGVVKNDIESISDEVTVVIEEETTTPKPTTTAAPTTAAPTTVAPTTVKPTTQAPTKAPSVKVGNTKVKKAKVGKKKVALTLKKVNGAKGYRIRYSTSKKMKKAKTVKVKKIKVTLKKLKSKKVYYIQAQAYVVVKGVKHYGKWSNKKKTKKIK